MSARLDDKLAYLAPLSSGSLTRQITLKKYTGALTITPTQLDPGYYQCRVYNGTSADTISGQLRTAATGIADSALDLPAADAPAETLFYAPGDAWFTLCVDADHPYLAAIWNGGADSVLTMMKLEIG